MDARGAWLSLRAFFLLAGLPAAADEWGQFRGPLGDGTLAAIEYPLRWSETENVAWKVAVPGQGWSSPVLSGDRVFLTAAISDELQAPKDMMAGVSDPRSSGMFGGLPDGEVRFELLCFDLDTGRVRWRQTVGRQVPEVPIHPSNTYATETACADAERVYVAFGAIGVVAAFTLDGEPVWRRESPVRRIASNFGPGSSLRLHAGTLFVQNFNDEASSLTALSAGSGDERWSVQPDCLTSWSTPLIWRHSRGTELVTGGAGELISWDPRDGTRLWSLADIASSFSASPTFAGDVVLFGTGGPGSGSPFFAVKAGARGDITDAPDDWLAWSLNGSGQGMSSPLVLGNHLYLADQGRFRVRDVRTGEELHRARLPEGTTVAASVWGGDGRAFLLDEAGQTHVIDDGGDFELLHVNKLDGTFWSTPAVAGRRLLIRSVKHLYCIAH